MNPAKQKRNERLVELKDKGLTYQELADIFKISRQTAHEIYIREKEEQLKKANSSA